VPKTAEEQKRDAEIEYLSNLAATSLSLCGYKVILRSKALSGCGIKEFVKLTSGGFVIGTSIKLQTPGWRFNETIEFKTHLPEDGKAIVAKTGYKENQYCHLELFLSPEL